MIDDVRAALAALRSRGAPAAGDLSVVHLSPDSGLGAFAGLDESGRAHLLLHLDADPEGPMPTSDVAALQVHARLLAIEGKKSRYLDVTCLVESVTEVFEHFMAALLDRMAAESVPPCPALRMVLAKWRLFLVPADGPLGRERLAAILGELLVVRDLAAIDASRAIHAWVGPFGGRHDVRRGRTALEIKTTLSHTSRKITIHGEDQLDEPSDGRLYLHLVRLEEAAASGDSVASVTDELFARGVPVDAVYDALACLGLAPANLASTATVCFDVRERLTVPVDDATPRIVARSFVGGARPLGVVDLSYVIDLEHVMKRALAKGAYEGVLQDLVSGEEP